MSLFLCKTVTDLSWDLFVWGLESILNLVCFENYSMLHLVKDINAK